MEDFLFRYPDAAAMEEALRRDFVVGGHKAYWLARHGPQLPRPPGFEPRPEARRALRLHARAARGA